MSREYITARYAGRCLCGARFKGGDRIGYNGRARIGARIETCPSCTPGGSDQGAADFTDVDSRFEDDCASICGR